MMNSWNFSLWKKFLVKDAFLNFCLSMDAFLNFCLSNNFCLSKNIVWSNVPKAFDNWRNTIVGRFRVSRSLPIISIISKDTNSVECKVWNPNWIYEKIAFPEIIIYKESFQNIFKNGGNSHIDTKLSSLCRSSFWVMELRCNFQFACENFRSDWFKIKVVVDNMSEQL